MPIATTCIFFFLFHFIKDGLDVKGCSFCSLECDSKINLCLLIFYTLGAGYGSLILANLLAKGTTICITYYLFIA